MKIASSQSTEVNPAVACRSAYEALQAQLGEEPHLVYLVWSVAYPIKVLLDELQGLAPNARVHGSSSCLGGMTQEGFISEDGRGLAMLGIHDPDGAYGLGSAEIAGSPRAAANAALMSALKDADRPGEVPALVRLSATPGAEEAIIAGIEDVLGADVPIIGGSAADNAVEGAWLLSAGSSIGSDMVVVSVLFPSVESSFAFHSGYSPTDISGKATRADGRVLYEIDGQPAADIYNQWTGGAITDALGGGNVLASTTLFPLGRKVGEVGGVPYYQLSHPDGVTDEGALTLFSDIAEGEELILMKGSVDTLVTRAGRVAESARTAADTPQAQISGALVVYCAGCMLTVQDRMNDVVEILNASFDGAPFLGTFTFGEQGCFVGGENRHGNLMISVVTFGA